MPFMGANSEFGDVEVCPGDGVEMGDPFVEY
jgi:hypothetical protein